jgi:hypothetical protein
LWAGGASTGILAGAPCAVVDGRLDSTPARSPWDLGALFHIFNTGHKMVRGECWLALDGADKINLPDD